MSLSRATSASGPKMMRGRTNPAVNNTAVDIDKQINKHAFDNQQTIDIWLGINNQQNIEKI